MNNFYVNAEAQRQLGKLWAMPVDCAQRISPYAAIAEQMAHIPANLTASPTPRQTAQGAAIEGVYHPPVLPWEGHNEDVLFTSDVEHSSVWLSERAVIWGLIAISLWMSIAALMS